MTPRTPTRPMRLLFVLAASCVVSSAQSQAPSAAQAATSATPTLKASAQLVIVDVVVTGRDGKPMHGLQAKDFSLLEDNTAQTVSHFEEHTALTLADATRLSPMPKLPPGVFTNYTPAATNGSLNLLLLDALNTPMKDQAYVRQQLLAYIKSVPPGTRIAIFGLTSRLTVLQGFTSDPEVLKTVLTRGLAKSSALLDDSVGGGGIDQSTSDTLEDAGADPSTIANLRQFDAQQQTFQLTLRARYTLDAMSEIARYLSAMPGRKNLLWFSGSFPISILPDTTGTLADPFAAMADSAEQFRTTVDLLARSQVAVYPIDARGLMTDPVYSAATSRNYTGARGPARMQQDQQKFSNDQIQEHGTMLDMAQATGGHAFVNTNDLTRAAAAAIDQGSNFYTLTYTPTNPVRDGRLRKIKVTLARSGDTLAYRHGYYADDPDKVRPESSHTPLTDAAVTGAAGLSSHDSMHIAMTRGAPTPTEILMKVAVYPRTPGAAPTDKPAQGNIPAAKTKGPFRDYNVSYVINPSDIAFFRRADGKVHGDFDLVVFVYDPDGASVNSLVGTVHIAATLDELHQAFNQGIHYALAVSTPVKGDYFLRIAVHDLNRDRYGVVEVPTASVRNLTAPAQPQPAIAPAAAAAPVQP